MPSAETLIIGAGPIGLELAVALTRLGHDCALLDAGALGTTITRWPRSTTFFSAPERIAIAGVPLHVERSGGVTGERYLSYLRGVAEQFALQLHLYEAVVGTTEAFAGAPPAHRFHLETRRLGGQRRLWSGRNLVLAVGDKARARRLGIPGEDLPHVWHQYDSAHAFFGVDLLVVGGGNSALEATLQAYRVGARSVTLSYRGAGFTRRYLRAALRKEVELLVDREQISFRPHTSPVRISPGAAELADVRAPDAPTTPVVAEIVMICAGFEPDTSLFELFDVALEGDERRPRHAPETMMTAVDGLYVAGTAAGGNQQFYDLFVETCHHHVDRITRALTGEPAVTGDVARRHYPFTLGDVEKL